MPQPKSRHLAASPFNRLAIRTSGRLGRSGGLLLIGSGAAAWIVTRAQLEREHIEVHHNAPFLRGQAVRGPLTAVAQAEAIRRNVLKSSGGKSFAELPMDDPGRANVLNGAFLRASLFTSVLAFGVSALTAGLGALLWVLGGAVRRAGR